MVHFYIRILHIIEVDQSRKFLHHTVSRYYGRKSEKTLNRQESNLSLILVAETDF